MFQLKPHITRRTKGCLGSQCRVSDRGKGSAGSGWGSHVLYLFQSFHQNQVTQFSRKLTQEFNSTCENVYLRVWVGVITGHHIHLKTCFFILIALSKNASYSKKCLRNTPVKCTVAVMCQEPRWREGRCLSSLLNSQHHHDGCSPTTELGSAQRII